MGERGCMLASAAVTASLPVPEKSMNSRRVSELHLHPPWLPTLRLGYRQLPADLFLVSAPSGVCIDGSALVLCLVR